MPGNDAFVEQEHPAELALHLLGEDDGDHRLADRGWLGWAGIGVAGHRLGAAAGGRVLNVTARGASLQQARYRAYAMVDRIDSSVSSGKPTMKVATLRIPCSRQSASRFSVPVTLLSR